MSQKEEDETSEVKEVVSVCSQEAGTSKWGKITLSFAISAAYICLACYRSIVGPTMVNLAKMVEATLRSIPIIFTARSVGYVVGFIIGGIFLDKVERVYYRQIFIIAVLVFTAGTAMGVPFCRNITHLSGIFFASGIGLSILDIGLSTYVLKMWQGESNRHFQIFHFTYAIGYMIGPILARVFIEDIKGGTNITSSEVQMLNLNSMPQLLYAYVFLSLMLLGVAAFWFVMCITHIGFVKTTIKSTNLLQEPNKRFIGYAIVTTSFLMFLIGCIELGYQYMLSTFAFTNYGVSSIHSADIALFFWGFYLIGCLITILLAGLFHPHCLIILNNSIEIVGGLFLIFLIEVSNQYLVVGNCLIGLGASSLFANTILWFDSYVTITHKIMGILLFAKAIAELVIPEILGAILQLDYRSLSFFIMLVPIFYLVVFLIQCIFFYPTGEKYPTDFNKSGKRRVKKRYCPIFLFRKVKNDEDIEDPPNNNSNNSGRMAPAFKNTQKEQNEKESERKSPKSNKNAKKKPKAVAVKKSKKKKSEEENDKKTAEDTSNEGASDDEQDGSPEDSEDDSIEDEEQDESSEDSEDDSTEDEKEGGDDNPKTLLRRHSS